MITESSRDWPAQTVLIHFEGTIDEAEVRRYMLEQYGDCDIEIGPILPPSQLHGWSNPGSVTVKVPQ